jgi:hypothetical protein
MAFNPGNQRAKASKIGGMFDQSGSLTPQLQDILNKNFGMQSPNAGRTFAEIGAGALGGTQQFIGGAGAVGLPAGLATLNQILFSQGKTDPRLFNQQIFGARRGAEGSVQRAQQDRARLGLSRSGVGLATDAATRAGGESQVSNIEAREAQLQEARKRSDLDLLRKLIIDPQLQAAGIGAGVDIANIGNREPSSGEELLALLTGVGAPLLVN